LTGVHGQPIVVVCVNKTLRCESVDLHVAVKDFELLRMQCDLAYAETGKDHSEESPVHAASLMIS